MQLGGIHHVSAITGNASANVAFYTQVLGMRLVKKTVNQDDTSAYHLFYGDERGRPGTELTFFDWPGAGKGREGTGTVTAIALGVSGTDALEWWARRLESFGIVHSGLTHYGVDGPALLAFQDPEGQRLELVGDEGKLAGQGWEKSPVPVEYAIHGFYAVRLLVRSLEPSVQFLTEQLGFRQSGSYQSEQGNAITVFEVGSGGPGAQVQLEERSDLPHGYPGIGGVHHVAYRTPDEDEHRQWRERLAQNYGRVTPVIDRFYFRSIYFREPGGVLFEIATDGPGFATDEELAHLGERLSLPPFLEPQRAEIIAGLKPIAPVELTPGSSL